MIRFSVLAVALISSAPAFGQSFSCRIGTTPACLDYGDKVCSSMGKCVDSNAACFDSYQCNYEGFTCRSNVTACVEKYDHLLDEHNDLVGDYNDLLSKNKQLVNDYNNLLTDMKRAEAEAEDAEDCVQWATTLQEAQYCY